MELKKLNMLHEDVKDYDGTNYVVEWFGSLCWIPTIKVSQLSTQEMG